MNIWIHAKQLSKRRPHVAACSYELPRQPENLRELIRILVCDGVGSYNRRQAGSLPQPLTAGEVEDLSQVGRIGFGISFGGAAADPEDAVETAIRGFEDGLFRFFVGDREIEDLDAPLRLQEGDAVTIIRLVMLTGGMFW